MELLTEIEAPVLKSSEMFSLLTVSSLTSSPQKPRASDPRVAGKSRPRKQQMEPAQAHSLLKLLDSYFCTAFCWPS